MAVATTKAVSGELLSLNLARQAMHLKENCQPTEISGVKSKQALVLNRKLEEPRPPRTLRRRRLYLVQFRDRRHLEIFRSLVAEVHALEVSEACSDGGVFQR